MRRKQFSIVITALLLSIVFVFYAHADYSTAHVYKGNFKQKGTDLVYFPDSSVSAYGWTGAVDNAASKWSQASTQLNIRKVSSDPNFGTIAVFVVNNQLPPSAYALITFHEHTSLGWRTRSWTAVRDGTNFDRARIQIDHGYCMADGLTQNERWMVVGHEFGHALSLDHFCNPPAHSGSHWQTNSVNALTSPTSTDKAHLTWKWGN